MKTRKKNQAPGKWGMRPWMVTDEDIERARKIEKKTAKALKSAGITLSPDLEQRLMQAMEAFTFKTANMVSMPTGPEVRDLFNNLRDSAQTFRRSIEDIRHPRILRTIPLPVEMKNQRAIIQLVETIQAWERAAREAEPRTKKGPGPDSYILELIMELIGIYEAATGKQAEPGWYYRVENQIRGEFPLFVALVLDAFKPLAVYQSARTLVEKLIPQAISMSEGEGPVTFAS